LLPTAQTLKGFSNAAEFGPLGEPFQGSIRGGFGSQGGASLTLGC
jgi:hypothetical protein